MSLIISVEVEVDGSNHFIQGANCDSYPCNVDNILQYCDGSNDIPIAFSVGGGTWPEEIDWILKENNVEVLSGGAPYSAGLCFDTNSTYKLELSDSYVRPDSLSLSELKILS